jgi:hypothetical protein
MSDRELIQIIGPDAYIEAHAEAFDAILPGLGDALRDCYRMVLAEWQLMGWRQAAISGAAHELEFYGGAP